MDDLTRAISCLLLHTISWVSISREQEGESLTEDPAYAFLTLGLVLRLISDWFWLGVARQERRVIEKGFWVFIFTHIITLLLKIFDAV